jgi:hypothetical protein
MIDSIVSPRIEPADGADLLHEAQDRAHVRRRGNALDRHRPLDVVVLHQQHLAHAALAEQPEFLEAQAAEETRVASHRSGGDRPAR